MPEYHSRDAGAWKQIVAPSTRDGGAWKGNEERISRDGGAWKTYFTALDPLTASVSPTSVFGACFGGGGGCTATSNNTTCTPAGGTESGYTFLWVRVSGDVNISPTAPTSATTAFSKFVGPGEATSAVFKCVVDDSGGNGPVDSSNTVTVNLQEGF